MGSLGRYVARIGRFSPGARAYLLFTLLTSLSWNMFNLVFNLYVHALGYGPDFVGLLNGLPSVVVLALGLPVGVAADRLGYRPFLVAGAILNLAATAGLGLAREAPWLVGLSLLTGLSGALSWVIGAPLMAAYSSPDERLHLFSVNQALMYGSGLAGSLLAGAVPAYAAARLGQASTDVLPLRLAFALIDLFNLLALVPALRIGAEPRAGGPDGPRTAGAAPARPAWRDLLPSDRKEAALFARLLLPEGLIAFGAGAMVVFFQLYFNLTFGLDTARIGLLFAFSSVVTGAATLVSPLLAERWGPVRAVVGTQLASLPFLAILAYVRDLRWVVVAYYARNALMNMSAPVQTTFALEQVAEERRATLTSLDAMLGSLGRGGLGPLASGYLQLRFGFSGAFTLTIACYLVGTLLFGWFFRDRGGRRPAAGAPASGAAAAAGPENGPAAGLTS
ncbi:MAG: MFS transporter [Bacillota bacterium]|nr:MFS transporter [Bacillota bacterium]